MHSRVPRRTGSWLLPPALVTAVLVGALTACGSSGSSGSPPAVTVAPADMLLRPASLPAGFVPSPHTVDELKTANGTQIDSARTADVTPPECRPTADAELNGRLQATNGALLAARSGSANLVELVTTVQRDLIADIRTNTGACAHTETTTRTGQLAGTRVATTVAVLPGPDEGATADLVDQSLVLRSAVTTTLPDGGTRNQVGLAGYALVPRPRSAPVTVQLTVAGAATPASTPPTPAAEPMDAGMFSTLFSSAVRAAANAARG